METVAMQKIIKDYGLEKPELVNYFGCTQESVKKNKNSLVEIKNPNLREFIEGHINRDGKTSFNFVSSNLNNFSSLNSTNNNTVLNLEKINDIRFINKYLELVNLKLAEGGVYVGCVETYPDRKRKLKDRYPRVFGNFICILDYIFNRIVPKLWVTKKLYFSLTKGKGRVLSKAEMFGRLYSCGFEIVDEHSFDNLLYFVGKKTGIPKFDLEPTYGPFISLNRVGKHKKLFKVYKLRTMHPYSEYLQEYIYNKNKLQEGGKIKNDFRISPEGRFLRKIWLDEIPMLLNVLKGQMKLVGVRPLSPHYFSLYSKNMQELRTTVKPGFIPPFYVDNPKTLEEIMESERKYIESYKKNPFFTDLNYLVKALNNVIFKGFRSF